MGATQVIQELRESRHSEADVRTGRDGGIHQAADFFLVWHHLHRHFLGFAGWRIASGICCSRHYGHCIGFCVGESEPGKDRVDMSRSPLALSRKTRKKRSCTCCGSTHVTSGVNTRQTHRTFIGIQKMKTTAWRLDTWSSPDRRG
jgi:hypothetical protein